MRVFWCGRPRWRKTPVLIHHFINCQAAGSRKHPSEYTGEGVITTPGKRQCPLWSKISNHTPHQIHQKNVAWNMGLKLGTDLGGRPTFPSMYLPHLKAWLPWKFKKKSFFFPLIQSEQQLLSIHCYKELSQALGKHSPSVQENTAWCRGWIHTQLTTM